RHGSRLTLLLVESRHKDRLVAVIRNLACFAKRDARSVPADAHSVRKGIVILENSGVDRVRVGWVCGLVVTKTGYLVSGIKVAAHNHPAAGGVGRGDLVCGKAEACALGSENLCLGG